MQSEVIHGEPSSLSSLCTSKFMYDHSHSRPFFSAAMDGKLAADLHKVSSSQFLETFVFFFHIF